MCVCGGVCGGGGGWVCVGWRVWILSGNNYHSYNNTESQFDCSTALCVLHTVTYEISLGDSKAANLLPNACLNVSH